VSGEFSESLKPSENARKVEHEIEHGLAHRHGLRGTVLDGVHKLQRLDSSNAHGRPEQNGHQFQRDLKAVDHELHNKHLLPHLHIVSYGRHLGELAPDAQYVAHKHPSELRHQGHAHERFTTHPVGSKQAEAAHSKPIRPRQAEAAYSKPVRPSQAEAAYSRPYRAHGQDAEWTAAAPGQTLPLGEQADVAPPREVAAEPEDAAAGQSIGQLSDRLKQRIEEAKAGGRPLTIYQVGDSQIAQGIETKALAESLAAQLGLQPGQIQFSSVGVDSAKAANALADPGRFLGGMDPKTDMAFVSFGANEDPKNPQLASQYQQLLSDIRGIAPDAAIVVAGATDGNYYGQLTHLPNQSQVAAVQRAVAGTFSNSTFLDVRPQMGSVGHLLSNGLVKNKDYVHLTEGGDYALAGVIARDISSELE